MHFSWHRLAAAAANTQQQELDMVRIVCSTEPWLVAVGMIPTLSYLAFYALFTISHTPRAVQVLSCSEEPKAAVHWRLDSQSVYRTNLWSMQTKVHLAIHYLIVAMIFCYGRAGAATAKILMSHLTFSTIETMCWFIAYRKFRPMKLFLHLMTLPFVFGGAILARNAFFPSYTLVRIPDCSWGNRDGRSDQMSGSKQAKWSEKVGQQVCYSLLAGNFVCFFLIMIRMHNGVDVFLLKEGRFDLLIIVKALDPLVALPTFGAGTLLVRLFFLWAAAVSGEVTMETNQSSNARATSGPIFCDNWSHSARSWIASMVRDVCPPVPGKEPTKRKVD